MLLITRGEISPRYSDSDKERRRSSLIAGFREERDSRIENLRLLGVYKDKKMLREKINQNQDLKFNVGSLRIISTELINVKIVEG